VFASPEATDDELKELAFGDTKVREYTDGHEIVKTVIVPKRLVNIVVKG
jgi:leucyl-tRNA synthetase